MSARSSISSGIEPGAVIAFWREAGPPKWFAADAAFDRSIRDRFEAGASSCCQGRTGGMGRDGARCPGAFAAHRPIPPQYLPGLRPRFRDRSAGARCRRPGAGAWLSMPRPKRPCACFSICPSSMTRTPSRRRGPSPCSKNWRRKPAIM